MVALRSPVWPSPSDSALRASSSGPVTACCGTTARSACRSSPARTRPDAEPSPGPLVAAAVLFDYRRLQGRVCAPLAQLDDSKTRTIAQREELYDAVLACATRVSVIVAPACEVDRRGRAPREPRGPGARAARDCDAPPGALLLSDGFRVPLEREHRAIIGGDGTSAAIAAASIVAKVTRDRLMRRLHATYPELRLRRARRLLDAGPPRGAREPRALPAAPPLVRHGRRRAALAARGLMARAHALGRRGETLAAWLVRLRGGRVLARNTRVRGACEVDIVARYGRTLAVIEVKARRAGGAAEAVGPERVAGLSRAAQWLADSRGYEWVQLIRLDLVTIDGRRVRYLADAFRL